MTALDSRLTPAELRAGFVRLGLAALVLVVAALIASAVFMILGAPAGDAVSAGSGVIGIMLLLCGVVAYMKTSPVRGAARSAMGTPELAVDEEIRSMEKLALGLFAFGILFSAFALVLG